MPHTIEDITGSLNYVFYISGALLIVGAAISRVVSKPLKARRRVISALGRTSGQALALADS
ncbi:MAG: hypothetical protein M0036_23195 [Desulfobacteraceae bacterium]|nr:hypothetical protein [Desulfobacteraceae bacterium]